MLKAKLIRYKRTSKETLGCLVIGDQVFRTLEPSWKDNKSNISCIPAGSYKVNFLTKSYSGRYKPCFHVTNVPSRFGVLIHSGNTHAHTKGCIILGLREGILANNLAVLNSRTAMRRLAEVIDKQNFELEVIDGLVS